jgi:putative phosphoesterase
MRLAVLADTHGNLLALKSVLEDLESQHVDGMIVAGDYTDGPSVDETLLLLNDHDPWLVKGNSDISLIRYAEGTAPEEWNTSKQFGLLRWAYEHLHPNNLVKIQGLPEQFIIELPGKIPVRVVHGSLRDPYESVYPDRNLEILMRTFDEMKEPVLVCGHTHLPWVKEWQGNLIFNPGAVCGPLNGDTRSQYAILSWNENKWEVEHRAVRYDLSLIRRDYEESGLLQAGGALAKSFLVSIETGDNVGDELLKYAYQMAADAGFSGCRVVPDSIWDQAAVSFDWRQYT